MMRREVLRQTEGADDCAAHNGVFGALVGLHGGAVLLVVTLARAHVGRHRGRDVELRTTTHSDERKSQTAKSHSGNDIPSQIDRMLEVVGGLHGRWGPHNGEIQLSNTAVPPQ